MSYRVPALGAPTRYVVSSSSPWSLNSIRCIELGVTTWYDISRILWPELNTPYRVGALRVVTDTSYQVKSPNSIRRIELWSLTRHEVSHLGCKGWNSIRRIELRITVPLRQLDNTINVNYEIRNTKNKHETQKRK